jgi:hypothetical protein
MTPNGDTSGTSGTQPRVLFLAIADDVGMERLPAAIAKLGATCAILSPPGFYSARTRFFDRRFGLPRHRGVWLGAAFARSRLEKTVAAWRPDLLVPLDNVAALLLRSLVRAARISDRLRGLIEASLGASAGYEAACTRIGLMDAACTLPIRLPRHHAAEDVGETLRAAAAWGYPVVLKAEHTCGGHGVVIASNPDELRAALADLSRSLTLWNRSRHAGRQWMWSVAGMSTTAGRAPLLQEYVPGVPAMRTVAAWQGDVLDGVSFMAERTHPAPHGASSLVCHVDNPEMDDTVRRVVRALGCSGFVSFDFMLKGPNGPAYLIEMNPRPIGTTHLGAMLGHDLGVALLRRLGAERLPQQAAAIRPDRRIALFPKELERDPGNLDRFLADDIVHDVPHDDPAVIEGYVARLSRIHPRSADALRRFLVPDSASKSAPSVGIAGPLSLHSNPRAWLM